MTTASAVQVTNPGAVATKGRRKGLRRIWSSKEWKARKAAFLAKNPLCQMHNEAKKSVPATIPHHPYRDSYKGHYTDLELSACVAYCNKCHFAIHHGMKLCTICGEHYHRWDAEMCRYCFEEKHPEIVEARQKYVQAQRERRRELNRKKAAKARAWKKQHQKGTGGAR